MTKKIYITLLLIFSQISIFWVFAQENDFVIIPKIDDQASQAKVVNTVESLQKIYQNPDTAKAGFWQTYNQKSEQLTLSEQLASGVMNWDTILDYLVYFIRFLSQISLFIWGLMVIYAGYKYATTVFTGEAATNQPIKRAIEWILVVIFSYAIMRIVTAMFLS